MKFYLSSYKIGNNPELLKSLLPENPRVIYMSNAMDFGEPHRRKRHEDWDIKELCELGFKPEHLDLKQYFDKNVLLHEKLKGVDLMYCSGGNVFDLRIAMNLSGLDEYLINHATPEQVWAGYSAAGCILGPRLDCYKIVDPINNETYGEREIIYEGLNIVDFALMPHFDSDHGESADINKEIQYCIDNNITYKAVRDGEVIVVE